MRYNDLVQELRKPYDVTKPKKSKTLTTSIPSTFDLDKILRVSDVRPMEPFKVRVRNKSKLCNQDWVYPVFVESLDEEKTFLKILQKCGDSEFFANKNSTHDVIIALKKKLMNEGIIPNTVLYGKNLELYIKKEGLNYYSINENPEEISLAVLGIPPVVGVIGRYENSHAIVITNPKAVAIGKLI